MTGVQTCALPISNGIKIVTVETYAGAATNLDSVVAGLKAARDLDAVLNWSGTPAQAVFVRAVSQMNLKLPVFQGPGFGYRKFVRQAGIPAEGILFPGTRILVADGAALPPSQKALLARYRAAYEKRTKGEAISAGGYAWDALSILCAAVHRAASTEPAKVRTAIENLRGFPGTSGPFSFSAADHTGLGAEALQMLSVSNGAFVVYQAPQKRK